MAPKHSVSYHTSPTSVVIPQLNLADAGDPALPDLIEPEEVNVNMNHMVLQQKIGLFF